MNRVGLRVTRRPSARPLAHTTLVLGCLLGLVVGAAAPALAQPCNDDDGDGFQQFDDPSGCTLGTAADCNDSNALTFPGAPERCDNADNDCDGSVDDGPSGGDLGCLVGDGPGCPSPLPASPDPNPAVNPGIIAHCCYLKGICDPGGVCNIDPNNNGFLPPVYTPEGPQNNATCFDLSDNDCDGLADHADNAAPPGGGPTDICRLATDQFCNGFDDDFDGVVDDGFNVGAVCTAGSGGCAKTGVFKCKADGSGTECGAVPGTPKPEDLATPGACTDFKDNDCDGFTDVQDPACQQPETCDGLDNDGDTVIDNGFAGLGTPCSVGVGACERVGTIVCGLDKQSVRCDVLPGVASPEGPSGTTCTDTVDNDCDGFTDLADASCGSSQLAVECSLDLKPGQANDCRALHQIAFNVLGGGPNTNVTAELVLLSSDGEEIGSLPVANGDMALLWSTMGKVKLNTSGGVHRVTGPIPTLRVRAEDGLNSAVAYCSPIPFVKAFDPGCCGFTSRSAGDTTPVTVAIPGIDPHTLMFFIDGVDILAQLGINPATDFPGGPFGGTVNLNGTNIQVTDLVVSTTSNTITMNLVGLPCGGRLITTKGDPLPATLPDGPKTCYVDDYQDKCVAAVLDVQIDFPQAQQTDLPSPTPVRGQVCHGRQIANLRLNGAEQSTQPQILTPGDGKMSADTWRLSFDALMPGTDLPRALITGETPLGSLDRGSNRIVADVVDEFGNRAFDSVIAAVGAVAKPGVGPLLSQAQLAARSTLDAAIQASATEISNAFVLGLNEEAIDTIIAAECAEKGADFLDKVRNTFLNPTCKPKADPILKGAPCGSTDGANRCSAAGGVCSDLVCHAEGDPIDGTPCPDDNAQRACTAVGGVCARLCSPTPGSTLDDGPCGSFGEIQNCQNAGGSCPASIQTIETPFCTCNIPAVIKPTDVVQIDPNDRVTCDAELLAGRVRFTMELPDLRVSIGVNGSCDGFLCANASIHYNGSTDLTGMSVIIDVTEERLEGNPVDPALCGNGVVDAGEFCDATAPDGARGCARDFGGGDQHCSVTTGTACSKDGDCPGGEQCLSDSECNETCIVCTQPPHATEPAPPIDEDFVDLGCGCTLVTILTIGLVVVAFIFGGPILGFGAIGIAALIFALAFQFDVETISPPSEVQSDPIGIAEPMIDETVEEFGVDIKAEIENVKIDTNGLTAALKGTFSVLDPDEENPEVPGAVISVADAPMPPLPVANPGNAFFVLSDDTFNQLFASLAAGPMFKTGFELSSARECSVSKDRCEVNGDCPVGELCELPNVCESTTLTTCVFNAGCPAGQVCINCPPEEFCPGNRVCVPEIFTQCETNADCPSSQTCRTPKVCAVAVETPCTLDTDCGAEQECIDCPEGQLCGTPRICAAALDKRCQANGDCASGQVCVEDARLKVLNFVPDLYAASQTILKAALSLKGISGSTPIVVHGRPEMPPRLFINDDPNRCSVNQRRCEVDDDCKQCSVSLDRCSADADCPDGETCGTGGGTCQPTGPTPAVETDLKLNDFFLELLADRDHHGVDGPFGTAPNCFTGNSTTGDCSALALCLDVSFLTAMQIGTCVDQATGQMQPQMVTSVEAVQVGRKGGDKGEVCGTIPIDTPNDSATQGGFDTQTLDIFQNNAEENTPPLCVEGLNLAGLGTFSDPRLVAVDVPGGDPDFQDYLGITGNIVPPAP